MSAACRVLCIQSGPGNFSRVVFRGAGGAGSLFEEIEEGDTFVATFDEKQDGRLPGSATWAGQAGGYRDGPNNEGTQRRQGTCSSLLVSASPPLGMMRPAAQHCRSSEGWATVAAAGWSFA